MEKMLKTKIMSSLKIHGVMIGEKTDLERFQSVRSLVFKEYVESLAIVTMQQLKKFESNKIFREKFKEKYLQFLTFVFYFYQKRYYV
jgi:hypothetical protein